MESKSERTRANILESACICISKLGIEKTSITAIANKAGVSRGLVAHYLPKRTSLLKEVMIYIGGKSRPFVEAEENLLEAREALLNRIQRNFEFFLNNGHYFKCFMLFYYEASIDPEYRLLNTERVGYAVSKIRRHVEKIAMNSSRSKIDLVTESIHDEMIGAIQKFFIINHGKNKETFLNEAMEKIKDRIDHLQQ